MRRRAPLLVTVLAIGMAQVASAQTVRGRAVDGVTHAPVSGALVELRDHAGAVLQRFFTPASGGFAFTLSGDTRYQLRVAAIGYARHDVVDVTPGPEATVIPDIVLTPMVVTLPELHAMAGKRSCGKSELTPETFGGLLDGAQTALQVMDATLRSAQLAFEVQLVHSIVMKKDRDSSVSADTSAASLRAWPVRSLAPELLQQVGFARPMSEAEGGGYLYFGPDLEVLFSDWFLDTHCFTLDKGSDRGDSVFIRFEPVGKPRHVDLDGILVLDRATLTLRRLSYLHRHMPDGVPDRSAGGDMHFGEPSPGLWVPVDWAIWAPLTKSTRSISRPVIIASPGQRGGRGAMGPPIMAPDLGSDPAPLVRVVGREENRGRLLRILPGTGS